LSLTRRLSENPHLLRYPHPSSLRRTSMYASFLGISDALYLEIFHQPPIEPVLRQAPSRSFRKKHYNVLSLRAKRSNLQHYGISIRLLRRFPPRNDFVKIFMKCNTKRLNKQRSKNFVKCLVIQPDFALPHDRKNRIVCQIYMAPGYTLCGRRCTLSKA